MATPGVFGLLVTPASTQWEIAKIDWDKQFANWWGHPDVLGTEAVRLEQEAELRPALHHCVAMSGLRVAGMLPAVFFVVCCGNADRIRPHPTAHRSAQPA
jgi:hypothetical protein